MTTELRFVVPGRPQPKGRPRFGKGRAFTPASTRSYEELVQAFALQARVAAGWPVAAPGRFRMAILFVQADRRRLDLDNIAKSISDACNRLLYGDDSQIDRLEVERRFAEDGDYERVEVRVERTE